MPRPDTRSWDPAEHLTSEDDRVAYLDPAQIAAAQGDIARPAACAGFSPDPCYDARCAVTDLSH